jgi:hypothetical protein
VKTLRRWLKVLLVLAAIDVVVRWVFVPQVLRPQYASLRNLLLRDRSGGEHLAILFDSVAWWFSQQDATVRVIIVGDSTVRGVAPETDSIPYQLQDTLRHEMPLARVSVVDFSEIGLYAREALVFVAQALSYKPDAVVCQLTLRDLIDDRYAGKTTKVEAFVGRPSILFALPPSIARARYSVDDLMSSAIGSSWGLYAYRHHLLEAARAAAGFAKPGRESPPPRVGGGMDAILSDDMYHFPNANSESVLAIIESCRRTRGHCLVFVSPFNPDVDTTNVRAAVGRFRAMVRQAAVASGVEFEDYWDALSPENFRQRISGGPDAIHYNSRGYQVFGAMLAQRVVKMVRDQRIAELANREGRFAR